ncbi:hypothetical protein PFISCL1PPCAC_23980 [Pristionchus fissidentatus]|uniref:CUB domain-containing protein n=1 Tax=Pristionchus fissidentatus TaxID=1538716 RepID=A0AAV5WR13_9BILA|nr:hypothetical protein PFISCL1PPCAC_23980 [Pristionchus fissidentatus]
MRLHFFILIVIIDYGDAVHCVTNRTSQLRSASSESHFIVGEELDVEKCIFHSIQLRIEPPEEALRGNALWIKVNWEGDVVHRHDLEVYELVIRDGVEYRIPRHRKDQNLFVSARNSGFLVIIEGKGYESKEGLLVHFAYTASMPFPGNGPALNYSCPDSLVSLNGPGAIFRPILQHVKFHCAVQLNSTTNVIRLSKDFEDEDDHNIHTYYTRWRMEVTSMDDLLLFNSWVMKDDKWDVSMFKNSIVIMFESTRGGLNERSLPTHPTPNFFEAMPSCVCDFQTIFLNKTGDSADVSRTRYNNSESICFQITCSTTVYLDAAAGPNTRIQINRNDHHSKSAVKIIDGDFTLPKSIMPNMRKYVYNSAKAILTFESVDAIDYDKSSPVEELLTFTLIEVQPECICPSYSSSVVFEIAEKCSAIDCFALLEGNETFISYTLENPGMDLVNIVDPNGDHDLIYPGRVHIGMLPNEPFMIWFHHDNDKRELDYKTSKHTIYRGEPACKCNESDIMIEAGGEYEMISPFFNTSLSYCPDMNCTTTIKCPADAHIVFTINYLNIEDDRLNFYLESWGSESFMSYTQSGGAKDEVDTGETSLVVNFVSGLSETGHTGFNVTFRAIPVEIANSTGWGWWKFVPLIFIASILVTGFTQRHHILPLFQSYRNGDHLTFINPLSDNDDNFL